MTRKNGRGASAYRSPPDALRFLKEHIADADLACKLHAEQQGDQFDAGFAAGSLTGLLVAFECLAPAPCACPSWKGIALHERGKGPSDPNRCPHSDVFGRAMGRLRAIPKKEKD